jgi:hypothetical protein
MLPPVPNSGVTTTNDNRQKTFMNILSRKLVFGALLSGAALSLAVADEPSSADKTSWKVSGELEEACSCRAACPCWFKSRPSQMTCDGVQVIFIRKGHFGKTLVDGLAVAQFVQSPEGKSMFESFGNWNFDNVYIDEKANEEQRQALKTLAAHFFPLAAKTRQFKFVPIARTVEGQEHSVTVGQSGAFTGHLIEGGFGGPPKVNNPPLADPTHKQFLQGETTKLTYSDAGQGWKYENSNYMYNKFDVDSKQYAKFEADMAKKMAEMKTGKGM